MKNIAIYGAGGFGREIACLIREISACDYNKKWNLIGFFDDGKPAGDANEYGVILGGMSELNSYSAPLELVMAIGKPQTLEFLVNRITNKNVSFPNLLAPDLRYLDKNNIFMGIGNVFFSKCSLSCNVRIGNFNIFNSAIAIGHDANIGNFNSFMPGTRISGEVTIGNRNFFGIYSIVLQQKSIGNNTIIGPASVVIKNTKDNTTYIGNPAFKLKF